MVVKNNRGLTDWIIQRISAILVGAYAVFLCVFFVQHPMLQYDTWNTLFSCAWMRYSTVLVVLAIVWHAWIGLWTVFTDYVKNGAVRLFLEIIVILLLAGYMVWVLDIFWR